MKKLGWIRIALLACMLGAVLFGVTRCHGDPQGESSHEHRH